MKIVTMGHTITEVPGLHSIVIEPSEASEYGVHVVLHEQDPALDLPGRNYGLDQTEELVEALTAAAELGRNLARQIERA